MPPNTSLKVQGVKVSLPQTTSQRRVVLEALEEKDEERALQVQDLDGWEWMWPNSAPVCEKLVAHLLIPKVDIQWHWLIWTHFSSIFSSVYTYIYIFSFKYIYIYISCMHADSYLFNPLVKWTQVTWTFFLSGKAIARPGVSLEETNQVDLVLEKCGWGGGNNLKISTGVLKSQNDRLGFSPTKTPTWRM